MLANLSFKFLTYHIIKNILILAMKKWFTSLIWRNHKNPPNWTDMHAPEDERFKTGSLSWLYYYNIHSNFINGQNIPNMDYLT